MSRSSVRIPARTVHTYQFEIDNFKKGASAPLEVSVGTAPAVKGMHFTALVDRLAFQYMIPLDWQVGTDFQMMFQCCIPSGATFNVGDKINLLIEYRINAHNGTDKLDKAGLTADVDTVTTTSPEITQVDGNQKLIVTGGNTEFYTYMPHINIPAAGVTPGGVLHGEVGLKSIAAGNVSSIVIYQMHVNYWGKGY